MMCHSLKLCVTTRPHTIGNSAKNATTTTVERKPEINPVTTDPSFSTINIKNYI